MAWHRAQSYIGGYALGCCLLCCCCWSGRGVDIRMVDGVDRAPSPPASETQAGSYQPRKR